MGRIASTARALQFRGPTASDRHRTTPTPAPTAAEELAIAARHGQAGEPLGILRRQVRPIFFTHLAANPFSDELW